MTTVKVWSDERVTDYDLNGNFTIAGANKIQEIFTGSDFDSTIDTTAGNDEQSYEMTAVTTATAEGYTYVRITFLGTSHLDSDNSSNQAMNTQLKAQIKEVGGAYGDIIAYTIHCGESLDYTNKYLTASYTIYHTLTAGEKSNGFQIKLFSKSTMGSNSQAVSFTNVQTTVELLR